MIIFNLFVIKFVIKNIYGLAIGYTIVMFLAFILYYSVFKKKVETFWENIDQFLMEKSIEIELSLQGTLIN